MEKYDGSYLKIFRIKHNIKQKEFAEKLGISASLICNIENKKCGVSKDLIDKFVCVYSDIFEYDATLFPLYESASVESILPQCVQFFKCFRKSRNISQQEMASVLDISITYISSIESTKYISLGIFKKFIELYHDEFNEDEEKLAEDLFYKMLGFSLEDRYHSMSNFIRYFRVVNEISQTQLANSLEVSCNFVSQVEMGNFKFSSSLVEKFLNTYRSLLSDVDKSKFLELAKSNGSSKFISERISNFVLANGLETKFEELLDMQLEKEQIHHLFTELVEQAKVLKKD